VQLFVGTSGLEGALERYAERFNLLELSTDAEELPRTRTLSRWRAAVPDEFSFCLRVPKAWAALNLEGPEQRFFEAAAALRPAWCVVATPSSVTPSRATLDRMKTLLDRLRGAGFERVAWEPRGVWQDEEAQRWAKELGVHPVVDAARVDPAREPVIYTRLRALGLEARVRISSLERVAERLRAAEEAWVVMEGRGAEHGARWLREALAEPAPGVEV